MGTECDHGFLWKPVPGDRGAAVTTFASYLNRVDSGLNQLWVNICGFKDADGVWQAADRTGTTSNDTVIEKAFELFERNFLSTGLNNYIDALKSDLTPGVLYLPSGVFKFDKRIRRPWYVKIKGAGAQSTFLQASSDFSPTTMTDGFALIGQNGSADNGIDGATYAVPSFSLYMTILEDLTLDLYSYGTTLAGACAFLAEDDLRKTRLVRVKMIGKLGQGQVGILLSRWRFNATTGLFQPLWGGVENQASHHGFRLEDVELLAFQHPTYGAIFIQGNNEAQNMRFKLFNTTNCGPCYFGGIASVMEQIHPQGLYVDEYKPALSSGFEIRTVLTNGPHNITAGTYWDATPQKAVCAIRSTGQTAPMSRQIEGGGLNYDIERSVSGFYLHEHILCVRTHWIPAVKTAANTMKVISVDAKQANILAGTLGAAPFWVRNAANVSPAVNAFMTPHYKSSALYPVGAATSTGGTTLNDTGNNFTTLGILEGWIIRNWTKGTNHVITTVAATALETADGSFDSGNQYGIFRYFGTHTGENGSLVVNDTGGVNFTTIAGGGITAGMILHRYTAQYSVADAMYITAVAATSITPEAIKTIIGGQGYWNTGDTYCIPADSIIVFADDISDYTNFVRREHDYKLGITEFTDEDEYVNSAAETGIAGEALTFGKLIYQDQDDGKWYKAVNTAIESLAGGIALWDIEEDSISTNDKFYYVKRFILRLASVTEGTPYYLSSVAGGYTTVKPVSGYIQVIGMGLGTDRVRMQPDRANYKAA